VPTSTRPVTDAARRIAEVHNGFAGHMAGGFCLFGRDGSGGEYYTPGSWPTVNDDTIMVAIGYRPITPQRAQELLDEHDRYRSGPAVLGDVDGQRVIGPIGAPMCRIVQEVPRDDWTLSAGRVALSLLRLERWDEGAQEWRSAGWAVRRISRGTDPYRPNAAEDVAYATQAAADYGETINREQAAEVARRLTQEIEQGRA